MEYIEDMTSICEECGSHDSRYVSDPFEEEMNNIIIMRWLCSKCEEKIALEV